MDLGFPRLRAYRVRDLVFRIAGLKFGNFGLVVLSRIFLRSWNYAVHKFRESTFLLGSGHCNDPVRVVFFSSLRMAVNETFSLHGPTNQVVGFS